MSIQNIATFLFGIMVGTLTSLFFGNSIKPNTTKHADREVNQIEFSSVRMPKINNNHVMDLSEPPSAIEIYNIDDNKARMAIRAALRDRVNSRLNDYFKYQDIPMSERTDLINELVDHHESIIEKDALQTNHNITKQPPSVETLEALEILDDAHTYSIANSVLDYLKFTSYNITEDEKLHLVRLLKAYQVEDTSETSKLTLITQVANGSNQFSQPMIQNFEQFVSDMQKAWSGYYIEQSVNN